MPETKDTTDHDARTIKGKKLSPRELAAVLGGLRLLQSAPRPDREEPFLSEVLTDGGTFDPLTETEIETLCQRLNG